MAIVEHRGYAIEAESVEMVFFEPEFAVAQQEIEHAILAIVEAQRVPRRVFASTVAIEILVVGAIESTEPLGFIFHRVGMHNIHNHRHALCMGIVDEVL